MTYRIVIEKPALKFLQKQPLPQRERLLKAIQGLPDVGDIKPRQATKTCSGCAWEPTGFSTPLSMTC